MKPIEQKIIANPKDLDDARDRAIAYLEKAEHFVCLVLDEKGDLTSVFHFPNDLLPTLQHQFTLYVADILNRSQGPVAIKPAPEDIM